jgi:hypothetical protein
VSKVGRLVDRILELALDQMVPEIKTFVGHRFPDDDVWLCFWIAKKFLPKAANAKIVFVNAGESLPGSEEDPSVLHFDTGGGEYDQHGKGFGQMSSAAILATKLELLEDPGLKPLIEMANAVDSINPLPSTSIHYAIEGYPRMFQAEGTIDWKEVQTRVFELFDIVYNQETARAQSRENLKRYAEWTTLRNGLKIVSILWHPELREAAFEAGATVVVWTQSKGKKGFYVGIQRSRECPQLRLDGTIETIRSGEAKVRQIDVRGKNLRYLGRKGPVPGWFLHDSLGLILCGSRSYKPKEDEYTKLSPRQIVGMVHYALTKAPRSVISRQDKK